MRSRKVADKLSIPFLFEQLACAKNEISTKRIVTSTKDSSFWIVAGYDTGTHIERYDPSEEG